MCATKSPVVALLSRISLSQRALLPHGSSQNTQIVVYVRMAGSFFLVISWEKKVIFSLNHTEVSGTGQLKKNWQGFGVLLKDT